MDIEIGSHCRYQIRYHLVWKVKYSRKILFGERLQFLKKTVEQIGRRYEYKIEGVGIDASHLHVFAGAHPSLSPAKLVQTIKSITARKLFQKYPDIKNFLWGGAIWAIGYYVRTVSDGPIDKVVKEYIERQNTERSKSKSAKLYQLKLVP